MYVHCEVLFLGYRTYLIPVIGCDPWLVVFASDGVVLASYWSKRRTREHRPWGQPWPFKCLGLKRSCPPYPQSRFCGLPLSAPAPRRTMDVDMEPQLWYVHQRSNQWCFNPVVVSTWCSSHQLIWSIFPGATWLPGYIWPWTGTCGRELHLWRLGGC